MTVGRLAAQAAPRAITAIAANNVVQRNPLVTGFTARQPPFRRNGNAQQPAVDGVNGGLHVTAPNSTSKVRLSFCVTVTAPNSMSCGTMMATWPLFRPNLLINS